MTARYLIRSPQSGAWFRGPGLGSSLDADEAYAYRADHPHLADMVHCSSAFGRKLILRQARNPLDPELRELEEVFERDIEATPAPKYVSCPDCSGRGTDCIDDPHPCNTCRGQGRLKVQSPTCIHGNHGQCLTCGWG